MKYDLMITDFDGTLGTAPDIIEEETVTAIKKFIDKGGKFVVCTGRPYSSIKEILGKYQIGGIVSCLQGAEIRDLSNDKVIFSGGIEKNCAMDIVDAFIKDGLDPAVFTEDALFYQGESEYADVYKYIGCIKVEKVESLKEKVKSAMSPILKIACRCDDDTVNKGQLEYSARFSRYALFNSGAPRVLETVSKFCSKGKSVEIIAEYYGIQKDKIITVGDSTNDIELVVGDWHGVAVGDGREELKKVAKEITVPFKDQPVKELLEKYCLR